jgi:hypothetical protein
MYLCLTTKALFIGADKLSPDLAKATLLHHAPPDIPEALYFVSYASNSHNSHKRRTYLGQEGLTIACYCCIMATLQVPSTRKPSEPAGPMPGLVKYTIPSDWWDHETVVGYPGDKGAENDGVKEILEVVSLLEEAGIPCCITDVVALQYYGASRVRSSVSAIFTSLQNLRLLITNYARTGESASLQYSCQMLKS